MWTCHRWRRGDCIGDGAKGGGGRLVFTERCMWLRQTLTEPNRAWRGLWSGNGNRAWRISCSRSVRNSEAFVFCSPSGCVLIRHWRVLKLPWTCVCAYIYKMVFSIKNNGFDRTRISKTPLMNTCMEKIGEQFDNFCYDLEREELKRKCL